MPAGVFNGDYRVSLNFRNQWSGLASRPYRTAAVSFDRAYQNFNGGFYILNNRAGAGDYNALTMVASGAYDYSLPNNPHQHFSFGIQVGLIHKSVDLNKLLFNAQYENINGGAFNTSLSNQETFVSTSIFLPEINVGGIYYFSSDRSLLNPFIGFSAFHLTSPEETFFGNPNRLPRRFLLHGGVKCNVSEKLQISAYLFGMNQTNDNEFTASIMAHYHLKKSDTYLMFGNTYRAGDAILMHFGIRHHDFTYRFSYDINTSTLSSLTRGQGGFEMSIVYLLRKVDPNPLRSCPRM